MMEQQVIYLIPLILIVGGFLIVMYFLDQKTLNIKSKTVGDGQHGTAQFATEKEISQVYVRVPYTPEQWRKSNPKDLPQGIVVGCKKRRKSMTAIVDEGDVHALMIGAAGVGKTAKFLYPNLEYSCACGMSFITTDTKGDLLRSYAPIAKKYYGYDISVIDLRNPTQSDGFNMLHLVNQYMDEYLRTDSLVAKAKAEKYAKITAKTIIFSGSADASSMGQNAYFYDAAEGLMTSVILVIAEFCSPVLKEKEEQEKEQQKKKESEVKEQPNNQPQAKEQPKAPVQPDEQLIAQKQPNNQTKVKAEPKAKPELAEQRHIVSVFKLIQDLLAPSQVKGKSQFKLLMEKLPPEHKARWFSGAALNTAEQAMQSVLSTALSRLNAFLDSELEQLLCFETKIDTEKFCKGRSALFLIMPEEDNSKYFLISLIIQQIYREMLSVADEMGGKLPNRVLMFLDEFGTLPKIESAEMMFSAARSRKISMVPIIQSLAQLDKNYTKEGAEIIVDNCQLTIYGGFAPNSETANVLSKNLGEKTVMTGSVSKGKEKSQSLQMTGRALITADELKSMPRDTFIVAKTGANPMKTKLLLFFQWGIVLNEKYQIPQSKVRKVSYADKEQIERNIDRIEMKRTLQSQKETLEQMKKEQTEKAEQEDCAKEENPKVSELDSKEKAKSRITNIKRTMRC